MRRFSNDDYFLDVLTIEDKSYKFSRKEII